MDLQVDYWMTGGKKEGSKVNVIGQLIVDKICWHSYSVSHRDVCVSFFPIPGAPRTPTKILNDGTEVGDILV